MLTLLLISWTIAFLQEWDSHDDRAEQLAAIARALTEGAK